ncbi:MAG TPA: MmgE/PrpD family protein, partial [Candidatus Binatia bacterium]
MGVTAEIAGFVAKTKYNDVPEAILGLAKGFVLDGLGVILAGTTERGSKILHKYVRELGGKLECTVLGAGFQAPAPKAALSNGVSGHAMDYDDTQLSTSKEAVYGLLTHPTTPVLSSALAMAELRRSNGKDFLLAYILGVEAECRIADAINPRHYQSGFHSTATIGGLGAAVAAGKLLRLKEEAMERTLGLAASMASGLRENFGTMTKP